MTEKKYARLLVPFLVFLGVIRTVRTLSLLQVNMTVNLSRQLDLEDSQLDSCLDLMCENLNCGRDGAISSCYYLSNKEPREVSCSDATDDDSDCGDWSAPISLRVSDVTMLLLNGSVKEIDKIPRETLVSFLWAVNRMELSEATKVAVWEVFKDGRNPSELKTEELEEYGELLLYIPESDLSLLNLADWEIVEFLGDMEGFSRRQMGILTHALIKTHPNVFYDDEQVVRINGLVCGFSVHQLRRIPDAVFKKEKFFDNLGACSLQQKEVLLGRALSSGNMGAPGTWTGNETTLLGGLLASISAEDLRTIKPMCMSGIKPKTIEMMSMQQILSLTPRQVHSLEESTARAYRRRTGAHAPASSLHCAFISHAIVGLLLVTTFTYVSEVL